MSVLMLQSLPHWITENRDLILTLFVGAVAGILAQIIVPGRGFGFLFSILLGLAGGWLGSLVFKNMLAVTHYPLVNQIFCSTAGAIILYLVITAVTGGFSRANRRRESEW